MATEIVREYWGYFNSNFRSILIGFAIFLLIFRWLRQPRHENLPPGPTGWPVFGHLLNWALNCIEQVHIMYILFLHIVIFVCDNCVNSSNGCAPVRYSCMPRFSRYPNTGHPDGPGGRFSCRGCRNHRNIKRNMANPMRILRKFKLKYPQ